MFAKHNKVLLLPFISLLISYLFMFTTTLAVRPGYWYDEIIVTEVSKQPLPQLMDTVKAEPHPFGLYILLKLFPVENPILNRLVVLTVSASLVFLALVIAFKTGILKEYSLSYGISLFLVSTISNLLLSNIKQDFLSLPLFILFAVFALLYVKKHSVPILITLFLLVSVSLFIGYISFFKLALLFFLIIALVRRTKLGYFFLATLAGLTITYFYFYGYEQLLTNTTRFTWVGSYPATLFSSLNYALSHNYSSSSILVDATVLGLIISVTLFSISKEKKFYEKVSTYLLIGFFVLGMLDSGLVRTRYVFEVFILLFVISGWGIEKYFKGKVKVYAQLILYFLILINGMVGYGYFLKFVFAYGSISDKIVELASGEEFLLLERHPIQPFVRKAGHFSNLNNIHPVNISYPETFDHAAIDYDILAKDGSFTDRSEDQIISVLVELPINKYIYVYSTSDSYYFDPELTIVKTLTEYCSEVSYDSVDRTNILSFEQCGSN